MYLQHRFTIIFGFSFQVEPYMTIGVPKLEVLFHKIIFFRIHHLCGFLNWHRWLTIQKLTPMAPKIELKTNIEARVSLLLITTARVATVNFITFL